MVSKTFRRSLPPFQCCRTGSAHRLYQWGAAWRAQVTQPVWSIASLETRPPPHIKLPLPTVPNARSCSFHYLNRIPSVHSIWSDRFVFDRSDLVSGRRPRSSCPSSENELAKLRADSSNRHCRNHGSSITTGPEFHTASQLSHSPPHSPQINPRSFAGGNFRMRTEPRLTMVSWVIFTLDMILEAPKMCGCSVWNSLPNDIVKRLPNVPRLLFKCRRSTPILRIYFFLMPVMHSCRLGGLHHRYTAAA
jgi:hypothetical protein